LESAPARIVRELTGAEMSLAMGRPNVIHAAAAEGGATRRLIEEARRREQNINNDIAKLQGDVDDLERRLDSRRCEIAAYQADLNDMVIVREQLYKADQHTRVRPPPIPRDALRKPSAPPGARLASFPTISRSNFPGASRLERQ
jgi:hypothetical protein